MLRALKQRRRKGDDSIPPDIAAPTKAFIVPVNSTLFE
jgi:hypothetical protein